MCSHRQFPSSHVFIYNEKAAQAAAILSSNDSISSSDYGILMRQIASRSLILAHLDIPSSCAWVPPLPPSQITSACLPLPLRFVAVCTAVLVAVINWFAAFLPCAASGIVNRSRMGQLLCLRCSSIILSPFIIPASPTPPPPLTIRKSRHRLLSLSFLLITDFAFGFFWVYYAPAALAAAVEWIGPGYRQTLGAQAALEQVKYWLMGNPAGLKLNNHLSAAASSACIHVLDLWLLVHLWTGDFAASAAAFLLRWGGCLGISFVVACALDASNIMCAWVLLLHAAFRKINSTLTSISASLFRLFRGKKWNPLRQRVDSCDASVDQWLLGTLAFSVLLFLMPTVVSFHLFFAIMRAILYVAQLPLQLLLFFLTETPIYPLMCRIFWRQQLCCSLLLRNISVTAAHQAGGAALSKATASVFALEADCEGWADVLKDMVGKMRLLFAVQFKHIKVERSGPCSARCST